MTFEQALDAIRTRIERQADLLDNEEATKLALIFPMLEAWGYDQSDPTEVRVEYPVKLPHGGRGRADCVIMRNARPAIVIECKSVGTDLGAGIIEQLRQYVNSTGASVGVVTDGIVYKCFADSFEPDRMDDTAFLDTNLLDMDDDEVRALSLLSKELFSPETVRSTATPLRRQYESFVKIKDMLLSSSIGSDIEYLGGIADHQQRDEATAEFLEWMTRQVQSVIGDIAENGYPDDDGLILTNEEVDGYLLVKGMIHGTIEPHRVSYRDGRTYFSVLVDDNNRKPLCRLHFNGRVKYVGTFDAQKQETRHPIEDLDDLIGLARHIRRAARQYAES